MKLGGRLDARKACIFSLVTATMLSSSVPSRLVRAEPEAAVRAGALREIAIIEHESTVEVVLAGQFQQFAPHVIPSRSRRGATLELPGVVLGENGLARKGSSERVRHVSVSEDTHGLRVNIRMAEPSAYRVHSDAEAIHVEFELLGDDAANTMQAAKAPASVQPATSARVATATVPATTTAAPTAKPAVPARATVAVKPTTPTAPPRAAAPPAASFMVHDVRVETGTDGQPRVTIRTDEGVEFRVLPGEKGPARLRLDRARLGASVPRRIPATQSGMLQNIELQTDAGGVTVVAAAPLGQLRSTAFKRGGSVVWLFERSGSGASARPSVETIVRERDWRTSGDDDGSTWASEKVARDSSAQASLGVGTSDEIVGPEAAGFWSDLAPQTARREKFAGKRIDLDFKDVDIHNILRLLAEVGHVNVVTSDDVSGTVTIRMKDVPWDQALAVILKAKGLGMERKGNLIRVAPASTLEKERELEIERQKQQIQLAPLETRLVPVSYAVAEDLQARVKELLTDRGTVSVDERTNVLVVRDVAESLANIERLVQSLDTQTPQVLVEARIVEASSQYSRDIGIQWGGNVTMSSATGNPTGLAFPSNVGVAGGNVDQQTPSGGLTPLGGTAAPQFAVNLPATVGTASGGAVGITLGSIGSNVNLNVRLSAAEANGSLRIISSPRVLTLDNHQATIAQGTLIPYSQVSAQGVQTAFQEAKLQLKVRPHVTSDGAVAVHVRVTRDEPDFTRTGSRGDPTILKREAETELLVEDGHTAVIGGIFTRNTGRNIDQIPFFGDLPLLGVLFQRRRVRDERNELLIFLTPRIVNREAALRR